MFLLCLRLVWTEQFPPMWMECLVSGAAPRPETVLRACLAGLVTILMETEHPGAAIGQDLHAVLFAAQSSGIPTAEQWFTVDS
jgi:hypothetical protein